MSNKNPEWTEAEERASDEKLLSDIQEYGWHVVLIAEDEKGPAFAFTVGLYHSYGHPEVLVQGLPLETMHGMLNSMGEAVKTGHRYQAGQRSPGILKGYDCLFLNLEKAFYHEYLGYARWYYRGSDFPALHCLWPDKDGRFPGEEGFPDRLADLQRLRLPEEISP